MNTKLIQIENRTGFLRLNDGIFKESVDDFLEDVDKLYGASAVAAGMKVGEFVAAEPDALEEVHLEINSPGGSVVEGERIYDSLLAMKARGVRLVATISGQAASMGSVIAMAADEVRMTEGSLFLIHDARVSTFGDAERHQHAANTLETMSDRFAGLYAARTGADKSAMRALMKEDRWMDAAEAKERGFIDVILKGGEAVDIGGLDPNLEGMALFEGKKELEARAVAAESDAAEWQAKAEQLEAEAATLKESAVNHAAEIAAVTERAETAEAAVADVTAKLEDMETKISDLEAEVEAAKESAQEEAIRMVAQAAIPQVDEAVEEVDPHTRIKAEYAAMPAGAERKAFREKHLSILSNS